MHESTPSSLKLAKKCSETAKSRKENKREQFLCFQLRKMSMGKFQSTTNWPLPKHWKFLGNHNWLYSKC